MAFIERPRVLPCGAYHPAGLMSWLRAWAHLPDARAADVLGVELHRMAYIRSEDGMAALQRDIEADPERRRKPRGLPVPEGFAADWLANIPIRDLEAKYGVSGATLRRWRVAANLASRHPGPKVDIPALFAADFQGGVPLEDIVRKYGICTSAVYSQARRFELSFADRKAALYRHRSRTRQGKHHKVRTAQDMAAASKPAEVLAAAVKVPIRAAPVQGPCQKAPPPSIPAEIASAVKDTGGKYSALADVARVQGISMAKAQQVWHQVRAGGL